MKFDNLLERIAKAKDNALYPMMRRFPKWIHPNHLTLLRIFLIAPILLLLFYQFYTLGFLLVLLALLTDFLDGPLARVHHQVTHTGKLLDPGSDKLLVYAILFSLGWNALPHSILWATFLLDLLYAIGGLLVYLYQDKLHIHFRGSNIWGKIKMNLHTLGIIFLFISLIRPIWIYASILAFAFSIVAIILAFEKDILELSREERR